MPFFWPWVRKVNVDTVQGRGRNLMIQHVDGIVRDDPEIADMRLSRCYQAVTDARLVDFDANKIGGWVFKCLLHERFAITESDLKNARRIACKKRHEIERHGRKV